MRAKRPRSAGTATSRPRKLKEAARRRVAAEASCDPRTVDAVFRGEAVNSMARERAYAVLLRLKWVPERKQDAVYGRP